MLKLPTETHFETPVTVQFAASKGIAKTQGDYVAMFLRGVTQEQIEYFIQNEAPLSVLVGGQTFDGDEKTRKIFEPFVNADGNIAWPGVLVGAKEIDDGKGGELTPEEGRAAVLRSPEALQATRNRFFESINQSKSDRTSSKRRWPG